MAKYTIQLRKLCDIYTRQEVENWFKSYELSDYLLPKQQELLENSNIWNKDKLAKKIVDHYFMREIGFETPALFRHYVKITMEEIMEEKLPLLYTTAIEYDPLINVDFTETYERNIDGTENNTLNGNNNRTINGNNNNETTQNTTNSGTAKSTNNGTNKLTNSGTSTSNSNSNSSGLSVSSDTPQGQINKNEILNGKYASNVTANNSESSVNDNTSTNNTTNEEQNNTTNEEQNSTSKITRKFIFYLKGNRYYNKSRNF